MNDVSFEVGEWAHQRTTELADQFRRADSRPLADLSLPDLERLDDKAKNALMLLRSHLTFCVRQAVPGHPHSMSDGEGTVDLRDIRVEIDSVIAEVSEARRQIGQFKRDHELGRSQSIVAANPETVHEKISAEERILQLEKQRRMGELTDAEFASALRAVLLSTRP